MSDVHHETIYFSGHVQGVGFRATALSVAREFEVAGRVRNLADGRVELELEGRPAEIEGVFAGIQERMHGYIRKCERKAGRRAPSFSGFQIA